MNSNTQKEIQREGGFTLLFAVLISVLVLAVGASVISVALKQSVLSSTGRESQFAFYAANTGLECALFWDLNPGIAGGSSTERVFPYYASHTAITDLDDITCADTQIATGDEVLAPDIAWTDDIGPGNFYASSTNIVEDYSEYEFRLAIRNNTDNGDASDIDGIEYCAEVTVRKFASGTTIGTRIESQGLNTCEPDTDPRAVQRGLLMQYYTNI